MTSCPMIALLFVVAAVVNSHTEAANCQEDQHCSNCNGETGYCKGKCHDGYYDLRCSSKCSSQCKNSVCEMTGTGIDRCTEGCKQGFQGSNCRIPCADPGDMCKQCPHGCDGEFCNLGSSCIAGCNNSYYGSHCSICSRRCKTCNVKTSTCEECYPGHGGTNCLGGCEDDNCTLGCKQGFYGPLCVHMCSLHCRPYTISNVGGDSLSGTEATPSKPECEHLTGRCVHGCVRGWYGSRCSSNCNYLCRNLKCDNTGACIDGCISGAYGAKCRRCPENCVNSTCHTQDGSCLDGCVKGFYGSFCDNTCESCLHGICNQTTGKCSNGCGNNCSSHDCVTGKNCDPSKKHRNTIQTDKPKGTTPGHVSPADEADGRTSYIVMSTAALVVAVSVAVVSVVRKICKRRSINRVRGDHDLSPRRVHTSSVTYETLHRYWDISDEDVWAPSAATLTSRDSDDNTDGVLPPLADVFGPNADPDTSQDETPEDLVWARCSYSQFGTDTAATVCDTKPRDRETRIFVRYLTPSDVTCQLQRTTSLNHWPKQPSSGTKDTTVNTI